MSFIWNLICFNHWNGYNKGGGVNSKFLTKNSLLKLRVEEKKLSSITDFFKKW